jgi:Iap family predicted aminopeptidase
MAKVRFVRHFGCRPGSKTYLKCKRHKKRSSLSIAKANRAVKLGIPRRDALSNAWKAVYKKKLRRKLRKAAAV